MRFLYLIIAFINYFDIFAVEMNIIETQKHSPSEVAQTVKDLFRKKGIQMNDFARDNNITPNQMYVILNGKDYINGLWSLRLNMTLGISMMYCISGALPIMDPSYEFDNLLYAATSYKEAVELEDRLRDEFELNRESLNPAEKAVFIKAIADARKKKTEEAAALSVLLRKGWNEDGEDEGTHTIISQTTMTRLKLHEAIEKVIKDAGRPLSFTEIAKQINTQNLYSRGDGAPVPASQISARVKNYPSWFTVNRDESPATVSLAGRD